MKTKISKDEFHAYEIIRLSGLTNMHDVEQVVDYSFILGGPELSWDSILEIQTQYKKFLELYPLPENNSLENRALELSNGLVEDGPEWLEPDPNLAKQAVEELRKGRAS
jgi:hypothetical protein